MADIKIGVDADDATHNIEQLQAVFERFHDASEKQVDVWGDVTHEVQMLASHIEDLQTTISEVVDIIHLAGSGQRRLSDETEKTSRSWQRLSRFTRDVASHVKDAASTMLKWTGIGAVVAGAAGFGAEHYLFDVAGQVGARRSTALGYGTTYGGLQSARANYARFGDADAALGNIAAAQSGDFDKRLGLQNLGVDASPGRDATEVLADVMKRAKDKVDAMPAGIGLAQYAKNLHLDDVLPLDTLQRLQHGGRGTRAEVYGQADKMLADRKGLDLAPDVQRKWQELATQLTKAGTTIETALVNRLVALEPGLQKLSDALATAGTILFKKDGAVAGWLDELGKGLDGVAKWLDDPDTQKRLEAFAGDVGKAAEYVWELGKKAVGLLHWLAQLVGDDPTALATTLSNDTATPGSGAGGGATPAAGGGGSTPAVGWTPYTTHRGAHDGSTPNGATPRRGAVDFSTFDKKAPKIMADLKKEYGLTDDQAAGIVGNLGHESTGFTAYQEGNPLRGRGGAGWAQWTGSRRRAFERWSAEHHLDPTSDEANWGYFKADPQTANAIAAVKHTRTRHEAMLAFEATFENAGIKAYGSRDMYADRAAGVTARGRAPAKVTVSTNSGGNPHTATAAAAAPQ